MGVDSWPADASLLLDNKYYSAEIRVVSSDIQGAAQAGDGGPDGVVIILDTAAPRPSAAEASFLESHAADADIQLCVVDVGAQSSGACSAVLKLACVLVNTT